MNLRIWFGHALRASSLELAEDLPERLARYVEELHDYNRVHRVVGALTAQEIASELVLDSLGLLPWIRSPLVDVGTGAGLPGLVLKLAMPSLRLSLIEPRQKPAAFLALARATFRLEHVSILDQTVESVQPGQLQGGTAAATIVSKGYGPLEKLIESAAHLAEPGGCILVPSSQPGCAAEGSSVRPHPLVSGRWIHVRNETRSASSV